MLQYASQEGVGLRLRRLFLSPQILCGEGRWLLLVKKLIRFAVCAIFVLWLLVILAPNAM